MANVLRGGGSGSEHTLPRGIDEIGDQVIEHQPQRGIEFQLLAPVGMSGVDLRISAGKNRNFSSQNNEIKEFCLACIIEVRSIVCDFIDPIDELALERRTEIKEILGKMREFRGTIIVRMFDDPFADLKGKIQAGKIEIGAFELIDDAQSLKIVVEARAVGPHQLVEFLFAGVAKRRMANVVDESESLGKIRIEAESCGYRSGNLRNLKSVGQTITKVIRITNGEHLRLGFEASEGARVNDAIAVALEGVAIGMRRLGIATAPAARYREGEGRQVRFTWQFPRVAFESVR